jgi:acyl-coenzyme A synthetase/AMP-(fatty) acid ligase
VYRAAEVEGILSFAGSRVMIVGPSRGDLHPQGMVLALRPRLPELREIVVVGDRPEPGVVPFTELLAAAGADIEAPDPHDPFLLLFTSGTTASPKATLHRHTMRFGNARISAEDMGVTEGDRICSIARFSHLWGLYAYWMGLSLGAAQVLLEHFSPPAFAAVAARARPTVAVGAPAHVAALLAWSELRPADLGSLRLFALSGSVCPPELARRLRATLEVTPLLCWGMTETGIGLYTRPDDPPEVTEHTVGRASRGCAVAVLDAEGRLLPPGAEGELAIRSPFACEGYVNNWAATAESLGNDGWFLTGDLASMDAAGNVRILGRTREQINRGGVKFHPADVEDVLSRHPAVAAVALVGMPDARLGERNCCFLVPRPGTPPTLADLTAALAEAGIARFKWPERLELVAELPTTPTGKVQRSLLRQRLREQLGTEAGSASRAPALPEEP